MGCNSGAAPKDSTCRASISVCAAGFCSKPSRNAVRNEVPSQFLRSAHRARQPEGATTAVPTLGTPQNGRDQPRRCSLINSHAAQMNRRLKQSAAETGKNYGRPAATRVATRVVKFDHCRDNPLLQFALNFIFFTYMRF